MTHYHYCLYLNFSAKGIILVKKQKTSTSKNHKFYRINNLKQVSHDDVLVSSKKDNLTLYVLHREDGLICLHLG